MSNNNVPRWTPTQYKGATETYQPPSSQYQAQSSYTQNSQPQGSSNQYSQHQTDYASRDRNRAMFHSTIAPTSTNETYNLSALGRNVNDSLASESKNQYLYGKGQETRDPASNALGRQGLTYTKDIKTG